MIEYFSEKMHQMNRKEFVILNADLNYVFDLDSIEKRLSLSKNSSQEHKNSFFKQDGNKQKSTQDTPPAPHNNTEGEEEYVIFPEYFKV